MNALITLFREYTRKEGWYKPFIAAAAVVFCTIYSFALLQNKDGFLLSSLILIGGICAVCCCRKLWTVLYLVLLMILTLIERHFIIHYNVSFQESGSQALITLNITDKEEILSYISLLRWTEFFSAAVFFAAIVLQWIPRFNLKQLFPGNGWKKQLSGIIAVLCPAVMALLIAWAPVENYIREWHDQKSLLLQRKNFTFGAKDLSPETPAVHFLVIGESHRKDTFDSIVLKGGSPLLTKAKEEGNLFEFDDMISYYQQTWFSVFTLLCRRGSRDMTTNFHEKGLLALFREAGWKVYYITYQPKTLSMTGYDCMVNESDVYVNARMETGNKMDTAIPVVVGDLLKKKEKKVLFVIKMLGCHFHYFDRYPQEAQYLKYEPCYKESKSKADYKLEEKKLLVNTYCNAMRFSAEVLDHLVQQCSDLTVPSFFFFLSDHGIINYDDGKNPFFGAVRSNFHVPCLLYGNESFRKQLPPQMAEAMRKNRQLPVGNDYVFDTIVSLAGLYYPSGRKNLDLTSPEAVPAKERKVWIWKKQVLYDSLP